jgi:hypothetical protein
MHAVSSRSLDTSASRGLRSLLARLNRLLATDATDALPAELRRLPDRLLRDIGVDPRMFVPEPSASVTPPDILHSPRAMAEFLATTVR